MASSSDIANAPPEGHGAAEVEAFLSFLANERGVSASTYRQALATILYLYKEVLAIELPWMTEIGRPKHRMRIPVVLSRDEVSRLLAAMEPREQLIAQLLYGCGLRRLRAADPRMSASAMVTSLQVARISIK